MHLIVKPSTRPPAIAWSNTHLCCEWGSCGTHTTLLCPSSTSWCCSFLVALAGCLGLPRLGFVLGSAIWGSLSLALDLQIQSLASSV